MNPKDIIGSNKIPLHLCSPFAMAFDAVAKLNGALKYGRTNYRAEKVQASIYVDAIKRHLDDWMCGFDMDEHEPVHNLAAAMASLDILIDALCTDNLVDDRDYGGAMYRDFRNMMNVQIAQLREKHEGKNPRHYTIQDNAEGISGMPMSVSPRKADVPHSSVSLPIADETFRGTY